MVNNQFIHDYNLDKILTINTAGFEFFVTPRYRHHYVDQEYEPYSISLLRHFLREGDTFVDVGAHYGYYSIVAGKYVKNTKIISVEPVKENFEILKKNIKHNQIKNWRGINCAVSDRDATSSFNITEASDSAGFYHHPNTKSIRQELLKTMTLSSILKKTHVDFFKIDVEGHELAVLRNFEEIIKNNLNVKLLIEFNPKCQISAGHPPEALITRLFDLGFKIFLISEKERAHYQLGEDLSEWRRHLTADGYCNLFCVPKKSFFSCVFVCHSPELGGAERSLLDTVINIREQDVLPHVIIPARGLLASKLEKAEISYSIIPMGWWASLNRDTTLANLAHSGEELLKSLPFFDQINPDIFFSITSVMPWGALLAHYLDKPHIWEITEFGDLDHGLHYYNSLDTVQQMIFDYSDKVIFISKALRRHYLPYSKQLKSELLYRSVSIQEACVTESFDNIYKRPQSLKLLIIGFIKKSKGQHIAIKAVSQLLAKGIDLELAIVGPTDAQRNYLNDLHDLIPPEFKSRFHFLGFVDNPAQVINQSQVVLVCSQNEAFGRVVIEGMYFGKVIIGSKSGAIPELVKDGQTGLLYDQGDIDDLASKIEIIFKKPDVSKKISINARKWAKSRTNLVSRTHRLKEIISEEVEENIKRKTNLIALIASKSSMQLVRDLNTQIQSQTKQLETQSQQIQSQTKQLKLQAKIIAQRREVDDIYSQIQTLEHDLHKIKSAKFFRLWQWYNSFIKTS